MSKKIFDILPILNDPFLAEQGWEEWIPSLLGDLLLQQKSKSPSKHSLVIMCCTSRGLAGGYGAQLIYADLIVDVPPAG